MASQRIATSIDSTMVFGTRQKNSKYCVDEKKRTQSIKFYKNIHNYLLLKLNY